MFRVKGLFIIPALLLVIALVFVTACSSAPTSTPSKPATTSAAPATSSAPATTAKPSTTTAAPAAGEITIKAITAVPPADTANIPFKNWVDKVNNQLKGQVNIKILGGTEIVASADQLQAIRNGVVDMSNYQSGASRGVIPEMLFTVTSGMSAKQLRDSGGFDLINEAAVKRANIMLVANLSTSAEFWMFWNTPAANPKTDFKGRKIRGGGTYNPGLKILGAEAVTIPITEIFLSLDRKVVDGICQPIAAMKPNGFDKLVKYGAYMGLNGGQVEVMMNADVWKKIPASAQQKMVELAKAEEIAAEAYWKNEVATSLADMQKLGFSVPAWSADDVKYFQSAWIEGLYTDLAKDIPAETIAKFKKLAGQ